VRVDDNGDISTLAVFQSRGTDPPRSTDSVPTSVSIGPDGAYYVGELSGFPAVVGAANVYRVEPGEAPRLFLASDACFRGFTTIIDIAFDEQGNLYVLQYAGTLVRVTPDRDQPGGICAEYQAGTRTTILAGLSQPTSVAVGPDGALYVSNHGASAAIGEVLRIDPSAASAWASDGIRGAGSKIAFSRLKETPDSNEFLETEIWVMNGDGSEPRRLTHNTTWDLAPVWSPNGKTVAFYGVQFDPLGLVPIAPPHIYLVDADGGNERLLTEMRARFPSWSAEGKIAFDNGGGGNADIFAINADGSGLEELTHNPAWRNIRPDWSPNGKKIAFSSRCDGNDEIYVMNADGSDPTRLTNNSALDSAPAWSPNGKTILFQSDRDGNIEIYVMDADGTDQTRLTDYPGRDQDADWSPNGRETSPSRRRRSSRPSTRRSTRSWHVRTPSAWRAPPRPPPNTATDARECVVAASRARAPSVSAS
jgi:TolB protein